MRKLLSAILLAALAATCATAQETPAFDAASVKPSSAATAGRGGPAAGFVQFAPGKVSGKGVTARRLILAAYHLTTYQLSAGPAWLDNDRFDVEAKASTPAGTPQLRLMLQGLLSERFHLTVEHTRKEMPVYVMTVGKDGPRLMEWKEGEPRPKFTPRVRADGGRVGGNMSMRATMPEFADTLTASILGGKPIVDQTGLTDTYFFYLSWGGDEDLLNVAEEAFGLRFESRKMAMEAIVINGIEKPDAN